MKVLLRGNDCSSFSGEQDELEFEIGCKFPENTELYSTEELESLSLRIKNPQMARVMTKWIDDLAKLFFQPEPTLEQYKYGFKSSAGTTAIYLTSTMRKELAGHLSSIAK